MHTSTAGTKEKTWHSLTAVKLQRQYTLYSCQMPQKHNPLNMCFFKYWLTSKQKYTNSKTRFKTPSYLQNTFTFCPLIPAHTHTCRVQPSEPSRRTLLHSPCLLFLSSFQTPKSSPQSSTGGSNCCSPVQLQLSSSVFPPSLPNSLCSPLFLSKAVGHTKVCEACSDGGCYRHWLVVL